MDECQAQRMEALRLYNKLARTSRFRRHQEKRWGRGEQISVVPALESDRVVDVEERVSRAGGTADVVVYWPAEGRISVAYCAHRAVDRNSIFSIDPVNVHDDSTVGMLLTLVEASASGRVFTSSRADVLALSAK